MREGIIFHPALDLSKLSDEEIHNKLNEIYRRISLATYHFVNGEVVSQLNNLQNMLVNEQQERLEKERYAMYEASRPKIIETEPDLRVADIKKEAPVKREETKRRTYVPIILKHWKNKP
jgi:hypothetical protein